MRKRYEITATIDEQQVMCEMVRDGTRATYAELVGGRDLIAWADAARARGDKTLDDEIQDAIDALNALDDAHQESHEHGGRYH